MDPHFNEYLAAIAGMNDLYGAPAIEGTSEFHEQQAQEAAGAAAA